MDDLVLPKYAPAFKVELSVAIFPMLHIFLSFFLSPSLTKTATCRFPSYCHGLSLKPDKE